MAVNLTFTDHNDLDIASGVAMATSNISNIKEVQPMISGLEELELNIETITEFYIKPIIYSIGIPGNILALILWVQPRLRNSSGCYFAALSISDTLVLVLHMLTTLEKAGRTNLLVTSLLCEVFNVLYVSSECLSLMLVLGLTVDRFIIVCFPMQRHRFCTIHRTLKVVAGQVILALVMGVVEGSFWTYSRSHHRCEPTNITGRRVFLEVGNIVILTFGVILPAILVVIFNVIIIANVQKTNKQRRKLCHVTRSSTVDIDATIMLLSISCYVILAEVPDEVAYLIRPFYPEGNMTIPVLDRETDPTWRSHYNFNITACILSTFSMTNYAVDIFIYSLTGRRFREMVLLLLTCRIFHKEGWRRFRQPDSMVWTFKESGHSAHDHTHDGGHHTLDVGYHTHDVGQFTHDSGHGLSVHGVQHTHGVGDRSKNGEIIHVADVVSCGNGERDRLHEETETFV